MMFWYGNSGWVWWQVAIMWIAMIAFWGVLIWAAYALVTGAFRRTREGDRDARQPGALQMLDERLARGEIAAEEYRRLRDVISRDQGSQSASVRDGDGDRASTMARSAHRTGPE